VRDGAVFFVAAREGLDAGERPLIRIARVPSNSPGIRIESMPPTRYVAEVPHAQIVFRDVALAEDALLPGDGYGSYVKPFRTVEDIHVNAAIVAYLLREARRLAWPGAWIERAAAHLHALRSLAAEDPSSPATHLALAGALVSSGSLSDDSIRLWASQDPAAARWRRDKELLSVAGKARAQRTLRAWERLTR
jgi:alkylation response protein AidB-like acyl-CoA dehydrogenase